jgi:O-antigen/teichoic acid export membrane protein
MFAWLIPLICFMTFCNEQLLNLARNNNEPGTYLKANMLKIFLELGISVVLVVFLAWRWEGRTTGILISYSILGLYALHYFRSRGYLFGKVKREYIIGELIYAVPIIALQASIFAMGSSDRFFLSHFTNDNNETVGIYSVAATFASIIFVICTAFLQYLFPRIYSQLSQVSVDYKSIQKHFVVYVGVMTAGMIGVMIFTPVAYHYFIHERYHVGLSYVFLLCGGYFLWSLSYFFYSFLLYRKEKRKILGLSACCIGISIVLNYFFIREWGAWGAAFSSIVTYMLVLLLTLLFTRPYWKNFIILNPKITT